MSDELYSRTVRGLQFNVAQLLKQATGSRRLYDVVAEWSATGDGLRVAAPLRGYVRFLRIGNGVLVTGQLETVVQLTCSRCLSEYLLPLHLDLEEEFRPTIDIVTGAWLEQEPDQDQANLIDQHHTLDLTEVIRQDIWLNLPPSPVCRPDCQGLCPQCGQNRNEGSCTCPTEAIDPRWASLLINRS